MSQVSISLAAIEYEIASMLSVPDEELDEEKKAVMDSYLDKLASMEAEKIDSFSAFIRAETARAAWYKDEGKRIIAKGQAAERRIEYLKGRYLNIMHDHGLNKIKGNTYSISVRSTPSVRIDDGVELDEQYVRRKEVVEPDKKAIKAAITSGQNVPGCRIVDSLSLQIR